jgi:hypothetical protein
MNKKPTVSTSTISLLRLKNTEPSTEARIAVVSLPVPMNASLPAGLAGMPTQSVDVGWWPDSRSGRRRVPRRRLMFALSDRVLPSELRLGKPERTPAALRPVEASISIVEKDYETKIPMEVGELRLTAGKTTFGLRLGIRWRDELHWWQWLRLETLWSGPLVTAYRVGGCIEVVPLTEKDFMGDGKMEPNEAIIKSPWLHRQDWLLGEAYILAFANGVIQFACRHVNNHRFDEGREMKELVPVIGWSVSDAGAVDQKLDGSQARFTFSGVTVDLTDALPLVSAEHPGSLKREGDLLVYQPYEGVEIAGDWAHRERNDGFIVKASERRMPKGVARTVRFTASLGKAAPVICRLTLPEWWYGLSGDLWPDAVLPAHDSWDRRLDETFASVHELRGRFDEGLLGMHWEGEVPYSELLYFYRTGNLEHHRFAIRDAFHIADIAFDHSTETIRMCDYPMDGATAPPLFRTVGMLFGYLETGDPYLLECAESAASHWYWMDRHMWPRYAFGRDGASIRSLVFLWDYLGKEDYATMAREAMGRVIQCQQADGSYRDQGSGTGIHGASHMPVKPWMANLATDPMIDYLERISDDPELWKSFLKYIDFIMVSGTQADGTIAWPYQVRFGDALYDPWLDFRGTHGKGRLPTTDRNFAHGHKARALNLATRRTGQARFYDAWLKFHENHWMEKLPDNAGHNYHLFNKTLQHLPYAQAHTWNARWRDGLVEITPLPSDQRSEWEGTIITPRGPLTLKLRRLSAGKPSGRKKWVIVQQGGVRGVRVRVNQPS